MASTPKHPTPALPSDSIIYADVGQAYELSRRQSRHQQTSFDYDRESVGQLPRANQHARRQSFVADCELDSSASESPTTICELSPSQRRKSLGLSQSSRDHNQPQPEEQTQSAAQVPSQARTDSRSLSSGNSLDDQTNRSKPKAAPKILKRQSASCSLPADSHQDAPDDEVQDEDDDGGSSMRNQQKRASSPAPLATDHQPKSVSDDTREARRSSRRSEIRRDSGHKAAAAALLPTAQPPDEQEEEAERKRRCADQRRRESRSQPPPLQRQSEDQQTTEALARGRRRKKSSSGIHQMERAVPDDAASILTTSSNSSGGSRRRAVSVSPSLVSSVNIRQILENVADVEGPFVDPQLAVRVALDALDSACWSTKVEGILALIRLAAHHQQQLVAFGQVHEIVCKTADETRNLRSTVARSAIFALGDYCARLKRHIEPELDQIVQSLMQKSSESSTFIRDDIRRALTQMVDSCTHWRLTVTLLHHGANHKNTNVRKMASRFVAMLVERMGAPKCLVGAKDIGAQLIPAAIKFAQDNSPHTRYYGRLILSKLMQHVAFERLLRKYLTPNVYRSCMGILENVKRRGAGEMVGEF